MTDLDYSHRPRGLEQFLEDTKSEYSMLRQEILQYMEEYQSLRNMMYVGTAALLGITAWTSISGYLFLLPLVIILPSYIVFFDYWKSVTIDSCYIQIFLERSIDHIALSPRHKWETRHNSFNRLKGMVLLHDDIRWSGMHIQQVPYYACAFACFVIYPKNRIIRRGCSVTPYF